MKFATKLIAIMMSLVVIPAVVFAEGEDTTSTVRVIADATNDSVTKNVGNVTVTSEFEDDETYGVFVSAKDGKTATVKVDDIHVNAPGLDVQKGVLAQVIEDTAGHIDVTTGKIISAEDGVRADVYTAGGEVFVTVNGDIQSGAYVGDDGERYGFGLFAEVMKKGEIHFVINGNVSAPRVGAYFSSINGEEANSDGVLNVSVYGDITSTEGTGLEFAGKTDKTDILVTGKISGVVGGVNSDLYNLTDGRYNNLTVWKIESAKGGLVTKIIEYGKYEADDDFAKKINYIVHYADDVLLKKEDGSALDTSHNFSVAKEDEKIIISTPLAGRYVTRAFNNGVEITTKDENGFYLIVARGGGINITVQTEPDKCPDDPNKFEPGICGCGISDGDSDGDGAIDCQDGCPNDPRNNGIKPPAEGCFIDGSDIPERYDPKIKTDIVANPKTKVLPPFVLSDGNKANVYFERFAGGVVKVSDKKFATTKYELVIKTKNKKGLTKKTVTQALSNNVRKFNLKNGVTITVQYRVLITKKVGKKKVTKRTKMSKAVKLKL